MWECRGSWFRLCTLPHSTPSSFPNLKISPVATVALWSKLHPQSYKWSSDGQLPGLQIYTVWAGGAPRMSDLQTGRLRPFKKCLRPFHCKFQGPCMSNLEVALGSEKPHPIGRGMTGGDQNIVLHKRGSSCLHLRQY